MSTNCPQCTLDTILLAADHYECSTCGFEWPKDDDDSDAVRVVKDSNGQVLQDGDTVTLIKELKLKGSNSLKIGAKAKNIRLVDGDHEIDCKIDGVGYMLKASFVKKA